MKSKASLALMELLVMVLIFSMAAALCLGAFVQADRVSRETQLQDRAVALAQSGAEALKACGGDLAQAEALLDPAPEGLYLTVSLLSSEIPGLGTGEITVYNKETGKAIFSLTAAWQEVD